MNAYPFQYDFEASFMEIYNETIRDLLGNGKDLKHDIKMVAANTSEVMVTNMTCIKVLHQEQVNGRTSIVGSHYDQVNFLLNNHKDTP